MLEIIEKLSDKLKTELNSANEIWVAVSLINLEGLNFILDNVKKNCKQNYLIGIDLPTNPNALEKLNKLQLKNEINVKVFLDKKKFFHPKLYLIQNNNEIIAYLGSANCTNGGLIENIELGFCTKDQKICFDLKEWFNKQYEKSTHLTGDFLIQYKNEFDKRLKIISKEKKIAKKTKIKINQTYEMNLRNRKKLVNRLIKLRNKEKEYNKIVEERENVIKELKESLDYPTFNNIDIEKFFRIRELGHIIEIAKPSIKRNIEKVKELLKLLCDENIDIAEKYNNAISSNWKIERVNKAFITKILTIHRPDLYYVRNEKSETALKKYGILLPRGLTEGDKYKIICKELRNICKESNIKDLAVLDHYLYLEGNIKLK